MADLNRLADEAIVLFADFQHGIVEAAGTGEGKTYRKRVAALATLARIFEIPIVVTTVPSAAKIIGELEEALEPPIHAFERSTTSSLDNAEIRSAIEATARTTLLIAGVLTEIAVQRAALAARARGYEVHVVLDACAGKDERSESAAIQRMTLAGVIMTSVPAVLGELAVEFTDPKAQRALALLPAL